MQMKFKAHQSFFIRKGWLSKGLHAVSSPDKRAIFMPSNSRLAMDELGLGSNQVVALRYWLQVTDLIECARDKRNGHVVTDLGRLILDEDPYMEEAGTLWALHCNLASSREEAAAWYFFFNEFSMGVFKKDDFTRALERYVFTFNDKKEVALTSLDADFSCILSTYIPHERTSRKAISPESVIDCPLGELGLLDVESRADKTYRKIPANPRTLPPLLVLYAICSMREHLQNDGVDLSDEMRMETLLDGPYSPGRIFTLDSIGLLDKLYELENDGYLRINRTAGLDVVRLSDADLSRQDCLARYYDVIG